MAKKNNDLEEVKADAKFNYLRNLKAQQEKQAYEEAKRTGNVESLVEEAKAEIVQEDTSKKGKK